MSWPVRRGSRVQYVLLGGLCAVSLVFFPLALRFWWVAAFGRLTVDDQGIAATADVIPRRFAWDDIEQLAIVRLPAAKVFLAIRPDPERSKRPVSYVALHVYEGLPDVLTALSGRAPGGALPDVSAPKLDFEVFPVDPG